jgi:uncharacterized protein (TIGR02246 family)
MTFKFFRYFLLCLLLFPAIALKAQDEQKIRQVLEDQRQAWNRGDLQVFMNAYLHSDSLLFVGQTGPNYGWQKTLDNYKKTYPDKAAMGTLTFSIKKVQLLSKDTAFVLGGWHLKRDKEEPNGYFTLVFRKTKAGWKIISDHSSSTKA